MPSKPRPPKKVATIGVAVHEDGSLSIVRKGSFDASYAEKIAKEFIILSSRIRATARQLDQSSG